MVLFPIKWFTIITLITLFSCSPSKTNSELIADANKFIAQGDNKSAVINLKNVLKNTPNDGDARLLLGKVYALEGNLLGAQKEYNKALELNIESSELYLLMAKNNLALSKFDEVISLLKEKQFSLPENQIRSLIYIGQALLAQENATEAEAYFNEASKIDPKSKYSMLGQALINAHHDDNAQALNILAALIATDKTMPESWLLKGSIESKINEFLAAADSFAEYVKLKPNSFNVKSLIAHNLIRAEKFALAQKVVDELLTVSKNHPTVNILAAQLALVNKDYSQAKELSNKVLTQTNNGLAQMISGLSDYYLGNNEQAYYSLNAISDALPKHHKIHHVLAVLQLKLGYNDELQSTLENINGDDIESANLFANIGANLARQGDIAGANQLINRAVNASPDDAKLKTQQGILKIINTDNSGELDLKAAIAIEPSLKEANVALALAYLKQNEIMKAAEIADAWLAIQPDNVDALLLRGNIAMKASDNNLARVNFKKANNNEPKNVTPLFNLAVLNYEEKKHQNAVKILDEIIAINPEYYPAYRLLISIATIENKEDELKSKLYSTIKETPQSVWPRIILSRKLNIEQNHIEANKLLEALNNLDTLPIAYLETLSNNYYSQGKYQQIDTLFTSWLKVHPTSIQPIMLYLNLLDKQQKHQQALDVIIQALTKEKFQSNFRLRTLESYFLLLTGQFEQAKSKAIELSKIQENDTLVLRIRGQLALIAKDFLTAEQFLSKSYEASNNIQTALFLATAYRAQDKNKEAIEFLESALLTSPKNSAYQRFLAEIYVTEAPKKAIDYYQNRINTNSSDVVSLNNLAWTLYMSGDMTNAHKFALQAQQLAPNNSRILDTLGVILLKNNDVAKSLSVLKKAHQLDSKDTEILIHLAQAYKANNNIEKANELIANLNDTDKQKWQEEINKIQ